MTLAGLTSVPTTVALCLARRPEASCTAGRAIFITGELPIRTGLTTVGQPGANVGIPDHAVTLATLFPDLYREVPALVLRGPE